MAHYLVFFLLLIALHIAHCFFMNGMILNPEVLKTNLGVRIKGNDYIDYNPEEGTEDVILLEVPLPDLVNVTTIVEIKNGEISVVREGVQSVAVEQSVVNVV